MPPKSLSGSTRAQPRRDALLKATVEIVAEAGVAGATHRAVTERAGLPLSTVSYYFPSIGALVAEALQEFARQRVQDMVVPDGGDSPTPALFASWLSKRFMDVPQAERLASFEILVSTARFTELAEPTRHVLDAYLDATRTILRTLEVPDAPERARAYIALSLGYGLLRLADPDGHDPDQLTQALCELFAGQQSVQNDELEK
ncbi:TetR/AcrR family transcriptional regulator [Amycolatopsis azurea]|uniref:TetR/AcrR family transcriptional regulator n=1 Tax=Amycolatopsis azurea TaxID=36819 RepID=UPI00380543DC